MSWSGDVMKKREDGRELVENSEGRQAFMYSNSADHQLDFTFTARHALNTDEIAEAIDFVTHDALFIPNSFSTKFLLQAITLQATYIYC
jgi:hypothetical protein